MNIVQLKDGVFEVGAVDWNQRSFHGYATPRGITYNAYLIMDEKITLIDTVKEPFADELLARIRQIVDPARIDYVVSNHAEPDHSGALPRVMQVASGAKVVTADPAGLKVISGHYGVEFDYLPVKAGQTLSLGRRELTFVATPMLHWPDNMVTWCPQERILFSNDAFGQHLATSQRFDEEQDLSVVMHETRTYYANILLPFGKQAQKVLKTVRELDPEIIAPSHGVIWRGHIPEVLSEYDHLASDEVEPKAVVVFDCMWGATEKMARTVVEGFARKGLKTRLFDLRVDALSDIMTEIHKAEYLAIGSPTQNNTMMANVGALLTYYKGLKPGPKKAFGFGSFGWSGQAVGEINAFLESAGSQIVLDLAQTRLLYTPDAEKLAALEEAIASL